MDNIDINSKHTEPDIYDALVQDRGWDHENAKEFASNKTEELKKRQRILLQITSFVVNYYQ